jgi:hypothetical protein
MPPELPAVVPLLTAATGAVLAYYFAIRKKKSDDLATLRFDAYTDFLAAVSTLSTARRLGKTDNEIDLVARLNDAKIRVCISGTIEVVSNLREFWLNGSTLERERELLAFNRLVLAMRKDVTGKSHGSADLRLHDVLFKIEPATFSYQNFLNEDGQIPKTDA